MVFQIFCQVEIGCIERSKIETTPLATGDDYVYVITGYKLASWNHYSVRTSLLTLPLRVDVVGDEILSKDYSDGFLTFETKISGSEPKDATIAEIAKL